MVYTSLGLSTLGFTQLLEPVGFCLLPYFFKDWLGQNFVGFFHIFPIFHKISISLWKNLNILLEKVLYVKKKKYFMWKYFHTFWKNPTYFLGSPVLLQAPVAPFSLYFWDPSDTNTFCCSPTYPWGSLHLFYILFYFCC